jgi:anti-sigma factor RsiW
MTERAGCGEFAAMAAELALGVLTGRERADALAHLERCDACRETVRQFATTGEGLLGLLPAVEPPPGFESRVLARIGVAMPDPAAGGTAAPAGRAAGRAVPAHARRARQTAGRPAGRPARGRRALAAAAVAVAAAAGLGGWALRGAVAPPGPGPAAARTPLRSAPLVSAGRRTVGEVFYYGSGQPWMYMTVDLASGNGTVTCELRGPGGRYTAVGTFRISGGYGSWGGGAGYGQVTGARLLSASGTVLAVAAFG